MQQLTGKDKETLIQDLQGVIFADPLEKNSDGEPRYYTADEYLSGDVRHKLQVAKLAAQNNPAFAVNVQALETVQPKDLEASEIAVRLGATKEANFVSWNGNDAKLDIRIWYPGHERCGKGVTLTEDEGRNLYEALKEIYEPE